MEYFDSELLAKLDKIVKEFGDLIIDKKIEKAKRLDGETIVQCRLFFKDGSKLAVYERCMALSTKYGYQWMRSDNSLIICWDNADHHPEIETHPHHKHIETRQNVQPSEEMNTKKVLAFIAKIIGIFVLIGFAALVAFAQ